MSQPEETANAKSQRWELTWKHWKTSVAGGYLWGAKDGEAGSGQNWENYERDFGCSLERNGNPLEARECRGRLYILESSQAGSCLVNGLAGPDTLGQLWYLDEEREGRGPGGGGEKWWKSVSTWKTWLDWLTQPGRSRTTINSGLFG